MENVERVARKVNEHANFTTKINNLQSSWKAFLCDVYCESLHAESLYVRSRFRAGAYFDVAVMISMDVAPTFCG